nr:hypothetical protein [Tanacetum cinerariifolium]
MDFSDSEVYINNTCSKTCLKSYETLKKQYDDLRIEFTKSEFNLATYKRGLAFVEEQYVFYKKNEVIFCEKIVVLKRDLSYRDSEISGLKCELEKLKKEKESNQLKIENFDSASKSLEKLIGSQISDNSKKGLGYESYHAVSPPPIGLFSPLKIDLSYSALKKFQQSEFQSYRPKSCETKSKNASKEIPNKIKESPDAPLVKDKVSNNKDCLIKSPIILEVQRSSRYRSMIIIIVAAWSKVTAARVESSYYCYKGDVNGISTASFKYYYCQGKWSELILVVLGSTKVNTARALLINIASYVQYQELRCYAQCLIEDEDFIKRSRYGKIVRILD